MHVLIGIIGLCGVLWLTVTLDHGAGFPGLFFAPAALLVNLFWMSVKARTFFSR